MTTKILVADDEVVSRTKAPRLLGKFGECAAVDCGAAAVKSFKASARAEPFDIVFMDIEMPGVDGVAALKAIREFEASQGPSRQPTPVVMLTAHSDSEVVAACIKAGCTDYIVKPFSPETL